MQNQTFISCVAWIHRGFAAKVPIQAEIAEEQIQQLKRDEMMQEELKKQKYRDQAADDQIQIQNQQEDSLVFGQQMTNKSKVDNYPDMVDDLQDDEKQDYYIKDTDALIVTGKIEQQFSSLEVYVYQQQNNNLFIHHELMLSSFPLSLQWLNVDLGSITNGSNPTKGNYAIVSSFLPEIQVWNLNMAQTVEPDLVLGGEAASNKKKPKKFTNKAKKWKQGSHTDSVLSISLNGSHKNILASGSADNTVKIWDLGEAKNIHTSTHHKGRVNKVKWSPTDASVIFTAGQDKLISVLDSRYPNDRICHSLSQKQSLVQSACWNVNQPTQICYTTDKGVLHLIDVRSMEKPVKSISPHQGQTITDIKVGSKNLCYTCSQDQSVRVWDLNNLEAPLAFKKPNCGKMYCLDLMQTEQGPIVSCGNGKGQLFVWDVTENQNLNNYWKNN